MSATANCRFDVAPEPTEPISAALLNPVPLIVGGSWIFSRPHLPYCSDLLRRSSSTASGFGSESVDRRG